MMCNSFRWLPMLALAFCIAACSNDPKPPTTPNANASNTTSGDARFRLLSIAESGITFSNPIKETDSVNYFRWMYIYNGGGVAVGDLNGDDLPDIYFTGNQVPNQLYLNKGGLKFQDVTAQAGVAGSKWCTGVTMADVNGDGRTDIYVTRGGPFLDNVWDRTNLLYLNNGPDANGVPTFTESAQQWQCNDAAFGTHASFFDYDLDGDLDLYVVNHPYQFGGKIDFRLPRHFAPQDFESDRLFRNEGDHFTDVTNTSGIARYAFGLSGSVGDFNGDGYPDIYVANDFSEPDFMFINQKDGTFKDQIKEMVPHISNFGMGSDVADFNDDGLPDILVMDMMAENNRRKKTNMSGMDTEIFAKNVANGFHYQYMQNTLLMNQGMGANNMFSDVAQLAGVSSTDWSWAPLIADFDNDGRQDIYITNGYRRDARDNDYVKRVQKMGEAAIVNNYQQSLGWMPEEKIANYMYQNQGDPSGVPTFSKVASNWGLSQPTWSNGAAYADLDNDGDLDLLVNNLDERAFLYENRSQEIAPAHWLKVKLSGEGLNKQGIGAQVSLTLKNGQQMWRQVMPSRGYQSSVEPIVHFGLGENTKVASLTVVWPNGERQQLSDVKADQELIVYYEANGAKPPAASAPIFTRLDPWVGIEGPRAQVETPYDDFEKEILLPHQLSLQGPKIAVGKGNSNTQNFYITGSAGYMGHYLYGNKWGNYLGGNHPEEKPIFKGGNTHSEETNACFFDANGDGKDDIYIVNGSNEFPSDDARYQDRLYLAQTGKEGPFRQQNLPDMITSGSVAIATDFDADGDQDLFVGGRVVPGKYPFAPRSYLLENDGKANFTDVTAEKAPDLLRPGMVTDALWADYDGDGDPDLVLSGEWMPITIFRNDDGKFVDATASAGLADYPGWWFSLAAADIDADGDLDFVAGNMGLNSKYPASQEAPLEIYCHDFDDSGSLDIVLAYHSEGEVYPVRGRTCTSQQMPNIQQKFPTYQDFAVSSVRDVYGNDLDEALHYKATTLATSLVINDGNGKFHLQALPNAAQISACNAIAIRDFDGDGNLDLLLAGNMYPTEVETSRADAGVGLFLTGNGDGTFRAIPARESGFFAPGDVRDMVVIDRDDKFQVVVSTQGGKPRVWEVKIGAL